MKTLTLSAPAKINLTLDILRKRPDGYHDLRMVMQAVSLCDTVTVAAGGAFAVRSDGAELPAGEGNLAYRAAREFFRQAGVRIDGPEILLQKRIPLCAGLAGGSADAAAVLRALRALCAPGLTLGELERIGEAVGSDVPFCVRGGTALAEGRGERLRSLPSLPPCFLVLCKPDFDLPTPALFGRVRVEKIRRRPDTAGMENALCRGDLAGAASLLCNVFEEFLTPQESGEIRAIGGVLRDRGALGAAMTGSGPTVFGIFSGQEDARRAAADLGVRYRQTFLAQPVSL